jgi:hypothetical protein
VDEVVLDLSGAYRVASLDALTRTFTHDRSGKGAVTVLDSVTFSQPEDFETALITYCDWSQKPDGSLTITEGGTGVDVIVSSPDGVLIFDHVVIQESSTPTRLCWRFAEPVSQASIRISVTPSAD